MPPTRALGLALVCLTAPAVASPPPAAKPPAPAKDPVATTTAAMAEAAQRFLAALSPEQKARAHYPFDNGDRESFVYVPRTRSGLPLKQLSPAQRALGHALLKAGLAEAGYKKASQIIELEPVLAAIENNPTRRDPENYYFWVFGDPKPGDATARWGWKFEGHHLSLNVTVAGGTAVATVPTFMGANPAEVRSGPLAGRRVLRAEEDLARELVLSFPAGKRGQVIFDDKALPEILTEDESKVGPLPAVGVAVSAMAPAQRELLRRLLAEYASAMPAPLAAARLARIDRAGFDKVRFGWAGPTERGKPHYYRVAGPSFVLEYDNTQNDANHIHTSWRDFEGDFGRDLLREHRKQAHH